MTLLLKRDRHSTRKPSGFRRPNLRHLFLKHCVGAWYFIEGKGVPFNYITEERGSFVGTGVDWGVGDRGTVLDFPGDGTADRLDLGTVATSGPLTCSANNECSVISRVYYASNSNSFPRIIDKSSGASAQNGWAFYYEYSGPDSIAFGVTGTIESVATTINPGNWYNLSCSAVGGGGQFRPFINGSLVGTDTVANNFPTTSTSAAIGNWNHTTGRQWPGLIEYVLVFDVALSDELIVKIENRPYAPLEKKVWVPVTSAVAGIDATATPGTLVLTGLAADQVLTSNIDASATAGALSLTGQAGDVEITVGTGIEAEGTPGTLTLSGQAADVVVTTNLDLQASAGAITLTGLAADFQTGVLIDADATPGAIALAGQAAAVDITTALQLEATPGAIVLSGQQADVIGLVAPSIARPGVGGIKSRYRRRKTIIIGKKRYQVSSREEEAMLVARYIEELKAKHEALQTEPAEQKKVTRRLKLATTRLRKLDVDPTAHLRAIDDELLTMLGGVPWL